MGFSEKLANAKRNVQTDENLEAVKVGSQKAAKALPSATVEYLLAKVPVIQWLPRYNPKWLINDVIAGVTLAVMLVPQALSYAKIATIPIQFGLMSSFLPAIIYTFMGTSKGELENCSSSISC